MTRSLALSLANSKLDSAGELVAWLIDEAGLDPEHASELSLRLTEFGDLRSRLLELLDAAAAARRPPAGAVTSLNETSARVPRVARLDDGESSLDPVAASAAALVLARVAWSAIDLLAGPDRDRIRRCGACGTIFVAMRPDLVWGLGCCGNRMCHDTHNSSRDDLL